MLVNKEEDFLGQGDNQEGILVSAHLEDHMEDIQQQQEHLGDTLELGCLAEVLEVTQDQVQQQGYLEDIQELGCLVEVI